jgi:hypothetical protein
MVRAAALGACPAFFCRFKTPEAIALQRGLTLLQSTRFSFCARAQPVSEHLFGVYATLQCFVPLIRFELPRSADAYPA